MTAFRSALMAPVLSLLLVAAPHPGAAQPEAAAGEPDEPTPGELLDRALADALTALGMLLRAVPRYAAPEITEDGDIVIRRLPPPEPPAPKLPRPLPGQTAT